MEAEWAEASFVARIALAAPAVRMVVIDGWVSDEGPGYHLCPVVAIIARVDRNYFRRYTGERRPEPPSPLPRELARHGWHFESESNHYDVLFCPAGEACLWPLDDWQRHGGPYVRCEVYCCPWPPDQDEARLREHVEAILADLATRQERDRLRGLHAETNARTEGPPPEAPA